MRTTFIIIFLFLSFISSAQVRVNCIIFVDGKIPAQGYISGSYFIYNSERYDFAYNVGDIWIDTLSYLNLQSLTSDAKIWMNFTHKKLNIKNLSLETNNYSGIIEKEWLFYDYLIINITNTHRKKEEYNFGYYTPAEIKKHIRGEYKPM